MHVVIALDHGGLERLVVQWTNARNRRRPDTTRVCCLDRPGALASLVEGNAVCCANARRGRFPMDWGAVRRLRAAIRSWRREAPPVVVHSHNLAAQQYAAAACMGLDVRHVHTEHGTNPHTRGAVNRLRGALLRRLTDVQVAVARDTARAMARALRVPEESLRVVPNGVPPFEPPTAAAVAAARRALFLPDDARTIGSLGRLAEVKGYDRLLRAVHAMPERRGVRPWFLALVGDGPERGALEELAARLGLAARVRFAGYRENAAPLLAGMDLFALPSRSEGLSVALLEAMSAGVPCLATAVGETRTVLEDGHCGLLLPDDEAAWPTVLTQAMDEIESDAAPLRARVEAARTRVREKYSMESTLLAYEHIYTDISTCVAFTC